MEMRVGGNSWRRFRDRRALSLTVLLLVLILVLLSAGTWAVWTVTDSNPNNTFSTNTITINDNQGGQGGSAVSTGTAMFNVTNLEPGSASTTACIGVNISGTASVASLTLTPTLGGAGQATLQNQLTMNVAQLNTTGTVTVTPGTNTNNGSCASYPGSGTNTAVGTQGSTLQSWAAGGPYTISSPVTNTWYKFTVSGLPAGDTNCVTYCNQTITVSLTWTLTTT
jgi:predicted ribosomally synthesized peptide with SipW-like signal peptide